jgi:transposase InsO family protein
VKVFGLDRCFRRLSKYNNIELNELSEKARLKFQVLDLLRKSGDVRLTVEHYRISRATLYRWKKEFNQRDPHSLEERSKRPHRFRRPQWERELQEAVKRFRESFGWGKDKLVVLLRREGYRTSTSTVGRILRHLKLTGELKEPPKRRFKDNRGRSASRYAVRKPKNYAVERPGDLIQVDTLDLRRHMSQRRFQFTARDTVSRWDVLEVHDRASAGCAAMFLASLKRDCPFAVKAIQVDGGSEFYSHFEKACENSDIKLFVLPPRSPKLNGRVERANRTHREEYYELADIPQSLADHNEDLKYWQDIYNTVRPHQALDFKTPLEVLEEYDIVSSVPP